MSKQDEIYKKALIRERESRKQAERILEEKSLELYHKNLELEEANSKLSKLVDDRTSEINSILDNVNDSYIMIELSGNVIKMNEPAKTLFGYDIDKGDTFNVNDIIFEDDTSYASEAYNELVNNKYFKNFVSRIYTKNKEVRWIQVNGSVISDRESNGLLAHGIVRDITEERERQEFLLEQKQ